MVNEIGLGSFGRLGIGFSNESVDNPIGGNGANGQVVFWTASDTVSGDNAFFWDNTNKRVGLNTILPENSFDLNGTMYLRDALYNYSSVYGKRLGFHLSGAKSNVFGGHYVGNLTNVGDVLGEGRNTAWGTVVMQNITSANRNIGVGFSVMQSLLSGIKNVIIGNAALNGATTANNNTGVGEHVLRTGNGSNNTVMGFHSAELLQGNNNVLYGGNVAANQVNGDGNHIFAYNGTVFDPNGSHQMNIANIIFGTNIVGGVNARVGIGTNNPQTYFAISSASAPDLGFFRTGGVTNSRNWAIRINGVEDGDFLIYQSAANGTTPLNTARFQISRIGNVNIGSTTTVDSAILHLTSTTRGFLNARMTTAQWNAIASKPQALEAFDITQQKPVFVGTTSGINQWYDTTIFTQTNTVTISNTTSELTTLGTGIGTKTLPANFLTIGKTIRLTIRGYMNETSTPSIRIRLKYGATTIFDSTAVTINSLGGSDKYFEAVYDITCRTTGATGTVFPQGRWQYTTNSGVVTLINGAITSASTIDTTVSSALDLTAQWGTASASNTINVTNSTIEILN